MTCDNAMKICLFRLLTQGVPILSFTGHVLKSHHFENIEFSCAAYPNNIFPGVLRIPRYICVDENSLSVMTVQSCEIACFPK